MGRSAFVVALTWVLMNGLWTQTAYASRLSDALDRTWGYFRSPVDCVTYLTTDVAAAASKFGTDVVSSGVRFVQCALTNANPKNLVPQPSSDPS